MLTYDDAGQKKTLLTPQIVVWVIPWVELAVVGGVMALLIVLTILVKKRYYNISNWQKYVVRKDDQLVALAEEAGIGWRRLARVNQLKKPLVKEGQTILVPPNFKKPKPK